jgi:hypothetical protein
MNQKNYNYFAWSIFAISTLIPFFVWGSNLSWEFGSITAFQWFPLFGLLAWMIMWTHYINGAVRVKNPNLKKPKYYGKLTAYVVLASLLLHPGILALKQFQLGEGIPPLSFKEYVGDGLLVAVLLGSISLTIFLSFEIFDRLRDRPGIKKWWIWISISQSLAMILIFVHGLRLGGNLSSGWFTYVWLIYGLLLLPCFYIIHTQDFKDRIASKS